MKIEAKYLTQVYGDGTYGLDNFTASIDSGDFVCVLGESGCGKTSLLRTLAGLEKFVGGELYLDGVLASDVPLKQRKTSMVFQEYALYPRFTVWENLQTALERYDLPSVEENKRIKRALADFDLLDAAGQLPRTLSGGQQQRVALAKAVVTRPELLLFDEPLSNVAEKQRASYMELLKKLKRSMPKTTFIYVTHNSTEALTLGNKLMIMKRGKVLQYGDTSFVASNPYSLDVLRTLFAVEAFDCEAVDGTVKYRDIEIKADVLNQPVKVAYNPFIKKYLVFNERDECLIGRPQYLDLNANYDGVTVSIGNVAVRPDENFAYRYLGEQGAITLRVPTDCLSGTYFKDSVELPVAKIADGLYEIDGLKVCLRGLDDAQDKVYFDFNKAFTCKEGVRTLAHYRVYDSACSGKIRGGKLRLPCGVMPYNGANGKVTVTVKGGAQAVLSTNGGLKFDCLAEDDFGEYRLAYCRLKGFDNYVTLNIGRQRALGNSKNKIEIDASDIKIN